MSAILVLFSIIFMIILTICLLFFRNLNYWKRRGIIYEKPAPFFGNMNGVGVTQNFNEVYTDLYRKYKNKTPILGIIKFFRPAVMILDLEISKQVLMKDFEVFNTRGFYTNENDPLCLNLLNLDGQEWKTLRKKLTPSFSPSKMKYMFPTIIDVANTMSEVMSKKIAQDPAVEICDLLYCFTIDVIGTAVFGIECSSLSDRETEFLKMGKKSVVTHHSFLVYALMGAFPRFARMIGLKEHSDEIINFFMNIVKDNVEYREQNKIRRNDFIDLLIELRKDPENSLDMKSMCAQVFFFFIAGYDTSGTTLSFMLYELARHQDIQDRLRSEILEVIQEHNGEFTYESMVKMKYVDQAIDETLRLHSIVPYLMRKSTADYVIPQTGTLLEKGTLTITPVYPIHHDPEYYPDPEKFDPDRFSPEAVKNRHQFAYLGFGEGPRFCIGKLFGKMQTRIALATLLSKFKFSVCDKTTIPLNLAKRTFVSCVTNGIYLKVEKIA